MIAVSPIVCGQAIKGPTAKLMREMGEEPTAVTVARRYASWIDGFVLDVPMRRSRMPFARLDWRCA